MANKKVKFLLIVFLTLMIPLSVFALKSGDFDLLGLAGSGWKEYPYQKGLIKFPDDEGQHNTNVEWWYLNFHFNVSGERYSGFLALTRLGLPKDSEEGYLLLGLTDKNDKKFYYKILKGKLRVTTGKLDLYFETSLPEGKATLSWQQIQGKPFKYELKAALFGFELNLTTLNAIKPPLTEGGNGRVPIGYGVRSYYYSLPRLSLSSGTFRILPAEGNELAATDRFDVKGIAWMDHQWFNTDSLTSTILPKPNHEWFSAQVRDNKGRKVELVFWQIFADKRYKYLGILYSGGKQIDIKQFKIEPQEYWVAPNGKKYAKSWKITEDSQNIDLTIKTLINNQLVKHGGESFYEGATSVSGKIKGREFKGKGFAELTHTY